MNLVCELNEFFIRDLHVNGIDKIGSKSVSMTYGFDYDLYCNDEDCHQIRMVLRVTLEPDKSKEERTCPYEIKATIEGYFTFSDELDDQQMAYLVRVNSATVLYGILRGEVANVTGSFPAGKFLLPTVMMQDVVKEIEARKAKEPKSQEIIPDTEIG